MNLAVQFMAEHVPSMCKTQASIHSTTKNNNKRFKPVLESEPKLINNRLRKKETKRYMYMYQLTPQDKCNHYIPQTYKKRKRKRKK